MRTAHVIQHIPLEGAGQIGVVAREMGYCVLASSCMNAGARVMYAMGRHQFFHQSTGTAHEVHGTPHVALGVMGTVMIVVVTLCRYVFKLEVLDEFNDAGTMGAFGFLGAYFLITIAAPVFVKRRGELTGKDIGICVAAVVLMLIPAVGSVYPVPDPPVRYFPYIFAAYLFVGGARVAWLRMRAPDRLERISKEIQIQHTPAGLPVPATANG